ncbi:MAG: ribosome silencing factor [Chlamydiales bacterium]
MKKSLLVFLNQIAQILFDKKGFNILALDVEQISTLTDVFLIAEGKVDKHVIGLANELIHLLKQKSIMPIHVEGLDQGDWVVIDYGKVIIHLFKPDMRKKYSLERLWHEGKIVDLELSVCKQQKGI